MFFIFTPIIYEIIRQPNVFRKDCIRDNFFECVQVSNDTQLSKFEVEISVTEGEETNLIWINTQML